MGLENKGFPVLGEQIRTRRKELGLTQEELGARIGVQKSAISKYEKGLIRSIGAETVELFGEALGVPASYLLMLDAPKKESPIVLTVPSKARAEELRTLNGVVRVTPEAELAIRALCHKTGLTQRQVASELIIQAAKVCEIKEEESD